MEGHILSVMRNCSSAHYNLGSDFQKKTSSEIKFVKWDIWWEKIKRGKVKALCSKKEKSCVEG
jgi:hypothetical protein